MALGPSSSGLGPADSMESASSRAERVFARAASMGVPGGAHGGHAGTRAGAGASSSAGANLGGGSGGQASPSSQQGPRAARPSLQSSLPAPGSPEEAATKLFLEVMLAAAKALGPMIRQFIGLGLNRVWGTAGSVIYRFGNKIPDDHVRFASVLWGASDA